MLTEMSLHHVENVTLGKIEDCALEDGSTYCRRRITIQCKGGSSGFWLFADTREALEENTKQEVAA
ncbi:hypothetical protein [Halomonas sp. IOP_31]|uniref:hypothetical protein n=1 Tax=Halomonas sp. IOP_31 TaxID=2876584 RepID=UPI001E2D7C6B|nr:hypothetical protein [Halomonas sp. IOP_31]MCD6006866.1 hypothetical protein [Halomonas sp. IOP_31]